MGEMRDHLAERGGDSMREQGVRVCNAMLFALDLGLLIAAFAVLVGLLSFIGVALGMALIGRGV